MNKLLLRPRAELDLQSIALFLGFEQNSPQAAEKALKEIYSAFERIIALPDIGKRVLLDGIEAGRYRKTLAGNYAIFYRFVSAEETVVIYRVLHQRQDIDAFMLMHLN